MRGLLNEARSLAARTGLALGLVMAVSVAQAQVAGTLVDRTELPCADCSAGHVLEKLRYRSDGLTVGAVLFRPRYPAQTAPRPVIVFNRGSYVRPDIAQELVPMFERLAQAGFVVVAPMLRGSDGATGHDELGGADVNDLMNIVPVLAKLEGIDSGQLFLYGESRGGMMVFQALRDGFPARAAATFGAFTDLGEVTATSQGLAMARAVWPDFEQRRLEIVARRSALQWPERLGAPLLLMHGGADRTVPPTQTLGLAARLLQTRNDVGVVVFAGGSHDLRQHQVERDREAIGFFSRYLRGP